METSFTPVASLIGGMMIGGSAVLLLVATGRIAGVSGLASSLLPPMEGRRRAAVGAAFVLGLLAAPVLYWAASGAAPVQSVSANLPLMAVAGFLVGLGTVTGNGCTSGHGVCGLSRLSTRSMVATGVFMAAAFATVFIIRHAV